MATEQQLTFRLDKSYVGVLALGPTADSQFTDIMGSFNPACHEEPQ